MKLFEVRVELPKRTRQRVRYHEWVAVLANSAEDAKAKYQHRLDENEKYTPTPRSQERERIVEVRPSEAWYVSMGIWKSK